MKTEEFKQAPQPCLASGNLISVAADFNAQKQLLLDILRSWNEDEIHEGVEFVLNNIDSQRLSKLLGNLEYVLFFSRLDRFVPLTLSHLRKG